MMEKYGVEEKTYRVVRPPIPGVDSARVLAENVSLEEAQNIQQLNPGSIVEGG